MRKRVLLAITMVAMLVCLFAVSVSAEGTYNTVYKESGNSEVLFSCTFDGKVVTDYDTTKAFSKYDSLGNALTWYLTGESETVDGVTVKYVASVKTSDVWNETKYVSSYTVGENTISSFSYKVVSACFDEGIKELANEIFGGYSKQSAELLFAYIPDSVEKIGERFCQYVKSVIVIEFSNNSKCAEIGKFFALDADSLRAINIPAPLKELIVAEGLGQFDSCDRLASVTFAPGSQLEYVGAKCFYYTDIESIVFPNSLVSIGSKVFQGCDKLSYVKFGTSFTTFKCDLNDWNSLFNATASSITIVLPNNNLSIDKNGNTTDKAFGYVFSHNNVTIKYAGTQGQFDAFKTEILKYSNNGGLTNANFKLELINECEEYYGAHIWSDTPSISKNVDYFASIDVINSCTRNCGASAEVVETISPMFVSLGYSVPEYGDGACSVMQSFKVDKKAIERYTYYVPGFEYGLIAAGNKTENGTSEFAPDLESNFCIPQAKLDDYDYFDIKITGITSENAGKNIVFCAYVKDGSAVYYLDNGVTSSTVTGISYNALAPKEA